MNRAKTLINNNNNNDPTTQQSTVKSANETTSNKSQNMCEKYIKTRGNDELDTYRSFLHCAARLRCASHGFAALSGALLRKAELRCASHGFAALSDACCAKRKPMLRCASQSTAERSVWLSWSSAWLRFQQHQSLHQ